MRFLLVACCLFAAVLALQCTDPSGNPVDWFFMLKTPKLKTSEDPTLQDGMGYMYWGPNGGKLVPVRDSLQSNKGPAARTLAALYSAPKDENTFYMMYNDHPPSGKTSAKFGHAKGVVALNTKLGMGYWLIHSVPRYPLPPSSEGYSFPDYAAIYGQSFLCISMTKSNFNSIGQNLQIMRPSVYDSHIPSWVRDEVPALYAAATGQAEYSSSKTRAAPLTSLSGMTFTSLAKNAKWAKEIYAELVGPFINDDLYSETWMRPELLSYCKPEYPVNAMNILDLTFTKDVYWPYTKDHSKWCVGKSTNYVCVGGINRMASQSKRPGQMACFKDAALAKALRGVITNVRTCN